MTSAGSAEAQMLAATVNSLMQNDSSSNNNTPNDDETRDNFIFQETPNFHPYENSNGDVSTNFLNWTILFLFYILKKIDLKVCE